MFGLCWMPWLSVGKVDHDHWWKKVIMKTYGYQWPMNGPIWTENQSEGLLTWLGLIENLCVWQGMLFWTIDGPAYRSGGYCPFSIISHLWMRKTRALIVWQFYMQHLQSNFLFPCPSVFICVIMITWKQNFDQPVWQHFICQEELKLWVTEKSAECVVWKKWENLCQIFQIKHSSERFNGCCQQLLTLNTTTWPVDRWIQIKRRLTQVNNDTFDIEIYLISPMSSDNKLTDFNIDIIFISGFHIKIICIQTSQKG